MKKLFSRIWEVISVIGLMIAFNFVGIDKGDEAIEDYEGNMY